MSASELASWVGRIVMVPGLPGCRYACRVVDARETFGRVDVQVEPVEGDVVDLGKCWVSAERVTVEEGSDAEVIAAVPCPIISEEPGMDETSQANARLIAAAPDLLAALEDALQWIEGNHHPVGECDCARCDCLILARAAIARARGIDSSK